MSTFSKNLIRLRKTNLLTQEKAAAFFSVKRGTYGAWEDGRGEPSYQKLYEIAKFYQITVNDLVGLNKAHGKPRFSIEERYKTAPVKVRKVIDLLLKL